MIEVEPLPASTATMNSDTSTGTQNKSGRTSRLSTSDSNLPKRKPSKHKQSKRGTGRSRSATATDRNPFWKNGLVSMFNDHDEEIDNLRLKLQTCKKEMNAILKRYKETNKKIETGKWSELIEGDAFSDFELKNWDDFNHEIELMRALRTGVDFGDATYERITKVMEELKEQKRKIEGEMKQLNSDFKKFIKQIRDRRWNERHSNGEWPVDADTRKAYNVEFRERNRKELLGGRPSGSSVPQRFSGRRRRLVVMERLLDEIKMANLRHLLKQAQEAKKRLKPG